MNKSPTTGHSANFRGPSYEREADGRIRSGMAQKNAKPVIDGLSPFLSDVSGQALEIGSGTGQHVIAFSRAFPGLRWTPSEPEALHRASIDAWRLHAGVAIDPAISLDAASNWAMLPAMAGILPLSLILTLNVIHISPFSVASGIVTGAGKTLAKGGLLAFYGPFKEGGEHTGQGNAVFDARLRADNPNWGVGDVDDIARIASQARLEQIALLKMPANNRILILQRQ